MRQVWGIVRAHLPEILYPRSSLRAAETRRICLLSLYGKSELSNVNNKLEDQNVVGRC